jgi:guanylate kinase
MVTAPSGAGKSSLVHALLHKDPSIRLSVSFTTRAPRPGEVDGREYNFTTIEAFEKKIAAGEFLEYAHVHGNYYGTSRVWIEEQLAKGCDVLLEIDWQGAEQVRKMFPEEVVDIFILPPSMKALEERLHGRGTDSEEVIAKRLAGAHAEMVHAPEFAYIVVNDKFETALEEILSITRSSRLRSHLQRARSKELFSGLGIS